MRGREQSFVRVSGGIITEHFVSLLQDEKHGFEYALPVTFVRPWREEDLPPQDETQFLAQVRDVWERLLRRFDEKFREIWSGRMSAEEVRRLWQRPVLDALGFEPTSTTKQIVISDRLKYRFSHRGWFAREGIPKPPVIHILLPGTDPDARPSRGEPSPHDALQDCLNRHDATWAVLMNETVIRVLRDYHHTTVPGYIEFDLEGIFLNRSFPEFLALYRLCHASRFARDPATGKEPLEEYYEVSRQAGEKIGESLRVNVVRAIEEFGNGFLDGALIERLRGDDEACRVYYQEILMVVYRIIFMLFAEQRGMLGGGDHGDLFLEEYSITSLRERVDAFEGRDDRNTDLWGGLCVTFKMLEEGVPELGVNAFDGMLFASGGERFLEDAKCRNTALMNAIRALTWTVPEARGHGRQRISYADLSVEEIGAIYESLLDYTPRITTGFEEVEGREYRPGQFMLDPRGSERKTTGSYYTNPDLIAELIKSALDPVIADRLSRAGPEPAAREKALLSIRVCDPACGSGAFLIAASNRLGRELAKIRAGTDLPSAVEVQAARRDVLSHCIYGVDVNPMAVELAKVSLWINALVGDKPLSFLDHHIKCGNSLIGATPELIAGGIPDGAYTPVEGDSKEIAQKIKAANKEQRQTRTFEEFSPRSTVLEACAGRFAALVEASEDDRDSVEAKKAEYKRLIVSSEYAKERRAADCWCAAFFWPLDTEHARTAPTTATVRLVQTAGGGMFIEDMLDEVRRIARKHRFFHWHLEFPEVFADGGFDCVLGNPPWQRVKLQGKDFFSTKDKEFSTAITSDQRKQRIETIRLSKPGLYQNYLDAQRDNEKLMSFLSNSMNFPLTSGGTLNTYALFTEQFHKKLHDARGATGIPDEKIGGHFHTKINGKGYAGIVTQTGVVTYDTYQGFFKYLIQNKKIVSIFDFINKYKIFKDVQTNMKFSLITLTGDTSNKLMIACHLEKIEDLHAQGRIFEIKSADVQKVNPITLTLPMFRTNIDANIIISIYNKIPILERDDPNEPDSWKIEFLRLFDMTNDRRSFKTKEELERKGLQKRGNLFQDDESIYLPLYESKLVRQFDHRNATFDGIPVKDRFKIHAGTNKPTIDDLKDAQWTPLPRYWVKASDVTSKLTNNWKYNWFIGFRNAISATADARSTTFCVVPKYGVGHSMPLIHPKSDLSRILALIGNFNSFVLDYVVRQKVSGGNLTYYIIEQLPIIPPSSYTKNILNKIVPCIVELVYTAWDLEPFSRDVLAEVGVAQWNAWFPANPVGEDGTPRPFVWDEERRFDLRCDLDALYFHLYEISREDVDYIMETFPIVRRKDEAAYGSYRTKETVLEKYDELVSKLVPVVQPPLPAMVEVSDWMALVASGESGRVGFAQSLSWDSRLMQRNPALEHALAGIVASFMNTGGGVVYLGVDDDGTIVGLDGDLKIAELKDEEGLRHRFDDIMAGYLGKRFLQKVMIHSLEDSGRLFWAVEVKPSEEPVFVKSSGEDEFWIRRASSSRKLSMREAVEYIGTRKPASATSRSPDEEAGHEE